MLKEIAKKYYIDEGMNCAEAIFMAGKEQYKLTADHAAFAAIGSFGGGCGCGSLCGAAAGACSVLGLLYGAKEGQSAHSTELSDYCKRFMTEFTAACGSELCREIMPKYKTPECRCLKTVEIAADILEGIAG